MGEGEEEADELFDIEEDIVQPFAIGEDENVAGDSATLQQALANQPEQEGDPSEEAQTEELEEEEEGDSGENLERGQSQEVLEPADDTRNDDARQEGQEGTEQGGDRAEDDRQDSEGGAAKRSAEAESTIYVGALAWATNSTELAAAFKHIGKVIDSRVIFDRESQRSRGFGFVTFEDRASVPIAIEQMNGSEIAGRKVIVNHASGNTNLTRERDVRGLQAPRQNLADRDRRRDREPEQRDQEREREPERPRERERPQPMPRGPVDREHARERTFRDMRDPPRPEPRNGDGLGRPREAYTGPAADRGRPRDPYQDRGRNFNAASGPPPPSGRQLGHPISGSGDGYRNDPPRASFNDHRDGAGYTDRGRRPPSMDSGPPPINERRGNYSGTHDEKYGNGNQRQHYSSGGYNSRGPSHGDKYIGQVRNSGARYESQREPSAPNAYAPPPSSDASQHRSYRGDDGRGSSRPMYDARDAYDRSQTRDNSTHNSRSYDPRGPADDHGQRGYTRNVGSSDQGTRPYSDYPSYPPPPARDRQGYPMPSSRPKDSYRGDASYRGEVRTSNPPPNQQSDSYHRGSSWSGPESRGPHSTTAPDYDGHQRSYGSRGGNGGNTSNDYYSRPSSSAGPVGPYRGSGYDSEPLSSRGPGSDYGGQRHPPTYTSDKRYDNRPADGRSDYRDTHGGPQRGYSHGYNEGGDSYRASREDFRGYPAQGHHSDSWNRDSDRYNSSMRGPNDGSYRGAGNPNKTYDSVGNRSAPPPPSGYGFGPNDAPSGRPNGPGNAGAGGPMRSRGHNSHIRGGPYTRN